MKTLLTAVALAAVIATPVLAQTTRTQNQLRAPSIKTTAGSPANSINTPRSPNDVFDISGRYIGSDPDPRIRAMMAMDPTGD